jgi:organic radical activating enzyme
MTFIKEIGGRLHGHKLEYNLADHCNLSCSECSHMSPYLPKRFEPFETFERDLNRLAEVYRVQRFRFVGGEPLLNRDIVRFAQAVRRSQLAAEVEVVTNGVLLRRVDEALLQSIDSIAVSVYPSTGDLTEVLRTTTRECKRHGVRFRVEHIDRFRRMQVPEAIQDEQLVEDIFRGCLIAHTWSCQTFNAGYFYLCSRPIHTAQFLRAIGHSTPPEKERDGVALHEPDLLNRLKLYLRASGPLSACRFCLGTAGKYESHRQMDVAERRHPVTPAAPQESIDARRLRRLLRWHRLSGALLRRIPSLRVSRLLAMTQTAAIGD